MRKMKPNKNYNRVKKDRRQKKQSARIEARKEKYFNNQKPTKAFFNIEKKQEIKRNSLYKRQRKLHIRS